MNLRVDLTSKLNSSLVAVATAIPVLLFLLIATQATLNNMGIANPFFTSLTALTNDPQTGHATTFGYLLFYSVILGLPLVGLLNLLRALKLNLKLSAWKLSGEVALKPYLINIFLALSLTAIGGIFLGHLVIDQLACSLGNTLACD